MTLYKYNQAETFSKIEVLDGDDWKVVDEFNDGVYTHIRLYTDRKRDGINDTTAGLTEANTGAAVIAHAAQVGPGYLLRVSMKRFGSDSLIENFDLQTIPGEDYSLFFIIAVAGGPGDSSIATWDLYVTSDLANPIARGSVSAYVGSAQLESTDTAGTL